MEEAPITHADLSRDPSLWQKAIEDYTLVDSMEALQQYKGSYIRYALKQYTGHRSTRRALDFRLGGMLMKVDDQGRYFQLKNVSSNLQANTKNTWSVQLEQLYDGKPVLQVWHTEDEKRAKRVTSQGNYVEMMIWGKKRLSGPEANSYHKLMQMLESGEYRIVKK